MNLYQFVAFFTVQTVGGGGGGGRGSPWAVFNFISISMLKHESPTPLLIPWACVCVSSASGLVLTVSNTLAWTIAFNWPTQGDWRAGNNQRVLL